MKRRLLITGAAGFIGAALAARLSKDRNHHLILVDNINPGNSDEDFADLLRRPNVEFLRLDLTDALEVAKLPTDVETIYHLAAIIGVEQVQRAPDRVLEVNAVSTLNVFNYARTVNNLKRLLFSSTSEVYSGTLRHYGIPLPTPETVPLCVDDIAAPRTSYALSKLYGEAIAFAWRNMHRVPITVVRYHNVYGPRMGFRHVIPQTFVKIRGSKGVVEVPSPEHTRAFCYIQDALEATILCAERDQTEGQIVHIGSSREEIAIRELVHKVAQAMGTKVSISEQPDTPGSPARRCPDTSALLRLTGFTAKIALDEGLRHTYAWYEKRL